MERSKRSVSLKIAFALYVLFLLGLSKELPAAEPKALIFPIKYMGPVQYSQLVAEISMDITKELRKNGIHPIGPQEILLYGIGPEPSSENIQKAFDQFKPELIFVGSLTMVGNTLSLDISLYKDPQTYIT